MDNDKINSFLNGLDSPVLEEKQASLLYNPFTRVIGERLSTFLPDAGKYLLGVTRRISKPLADRFQAGATAGAERYSDSAVKRIMAANRTNPNFTPNPYMERMREGAAMLKGGLEESVGQTTPGKAVGSLFNRNSQFWRGSPGFVLGREPLQGMFNLYAGYEGARKGNEAGGVAGGIAGGLGAFGASRAAWTMGDLFKRGLMRDIQDQMLAGRLTALRARPGGLRAAAGEWLERGGKAAEGLLGRQHGVLTGQGGVLRGTINNLQKVHKAQVRKGIKVLSPEDKTVALPVSSMGVHGGGRPSISGLLTVPLALGTMTAANTAAEAGGRAAFDGYKLMSTGMHQRQQQRSARENYLRRISPEFRSTGYNPYAGHGG